MDLAVGENTTERLKRVYERYLKLFEKSRAVVLAEKAEGALIHTVNFRLQPDYSCKPRCLLSLHALLVEYQAGFFI
jgi:hypothetical protein